MSTVFFAKVRSSIVLKGTLLVGAIATDGILIAADSRASIDGPEGKIAGYLDKIPKLFLLEGTFPFGFAGKSTIDDEFVHSIINAYNQSIENQNNATQAPRAFRDYLLHNFGVFHQIMLTGGYLGVHPLLCQFNLDGVNCATDGFLFNKPEFREYLIPHSTALKSCAELVGVLEEAIPTFALEQQLTHEIGGPLSACQIRPDNSINWLRDNFHENAVEDYKSLVQSIESGAIRLTPVNGRDEEEVIKMMKVNKKYKD